MSNWALLVLVGALSVIAGLIALVFPLPASLTVTAFVGGSLMAVGVLGTIAAFRGGIGGDRFWGVLTGIATVALGFILLAFPLQGMTTLTIVAGLLFLASGVFKLVLGWNLVVPSWKWAVALSGAVSLLLGIAIFAGLPGSAAVVPGLLLAVELLSYGWGMVFLGLAWRNRGGV